MSEERVEETRAEGAPHPVDEVLPAGRLAVLGFQHVLALYAGAVAVPLVLANSVIIVAISLALGIIPVAVQDFYAGFPPGVQTVLNSGITAGSIVAVVLKVVFNILGGGDEGPEPGGVAAARTSGDTRGPV